MARRQPANPPETDGAAPVAPGRRWVRADFAHDSPTLARRLLGQRLVRVLETGERLAGLIVETEAYLGVPDRAAHSFGGRRTARVEPMYGPPGTAYVYFTYGMHHCFNVVAGRAGEPVAVLVRALAATEGLDAMRTRRSAARKGVGLRDTDLCSGPGKLCQALAIDRALTGLDLASDPRLWVERAGPTLPASRLVNTVRVGVEGAGDWAGAPLRWHVAGDPHVSRR